jgi:transposase-like protein
MRAERGTLIMAEIKKPAPKKTRKRYDPALKWKVQLPLLYDSLRAGMSRASAATAVGIDRTLVWKWADAVTRGKASPAMKRVIDQMERAEAECINENLEILQKSARSGDATSARWLLARLDRERFGDATRTELTGAVEVSRGVVILPELEILELPEAQGA